MAMVAIPWFVLVTTGSPSKTGIIAFFTILPTALASFFGGTLVDRIGFRSMSVISDWASAVTMALIPLLHAISGIEFYQLIILVFFGALLDAPGTTARRSILPNLAEPAGMMLERATSINESIQRGSAMAGAPLAGVLIAVFSAPTVLWINAASFVVSALLIMFAVPPAEATAEEKDEGAGYFAELAEGLRFIMTDRLMRTIIVIVMITNSLDSPMFAIFLPVYARDVLDSSIALGVIIGVFGAFALMGALFFGAVGHRLPRRATFATAFLVLGGAWVTWAFLPPLWVVVPVMAVAGFAAGPINPLLMTLSYERVPEEIRGRVFGAATAGSFVAIPAGMLLAGYAIEWFGLGPTLAGFATAYVGVGIAMGINRELRSMDPATEPAVAEATSDI
jgi:MFS family permease